jgi:hypothetical protein
MTTAAISRLQVICRTLLLSGIPLIYNEVGASLASVWNTLLKGIPLLKR